MTLLMLLVNEYCYVSKRVETHRAQIEALDTIKEAKDVYSVEKNTQRCNNAT